MIIQTIIEHRFQLIFFKLINRLRIQTKDCKADCIFQIERYHFHIILKNRHSSSEIQRINLFLKNRLVLLRTTIQTNSI